MPKKTFAHDAQAFAEDVQKFVADTRERFRKLVDRHSDTQADASPESDEGNVWAFYIRAASVFDDVERGLTAVEAVARTIGDEASGTINARAHEDEEQLDPSEPSTHEPDASPKPPAKRAAAKKAPAKRAAKKAPAKKTATKKVTGD